MLRNVRGMNRNTYRLGPSIFNYLPLLHVKDHLDREIPGKNETVLFFKVDVRKQRSAEQHF